MTTSTLTVRAHQDFTGPIDTLLSMVRERKLPISEVSLVQVVDDYIAYTQKLNESHYGQATYFLVIAATLILIKSKALLPMLTLSSEEESSIDDLERRLKLLELYQQNKDAIQELFAKSSNRLHFTKFRPEVTVFAPHKNISQKSLREALQAMFDTMPKAPNLTETRVQATVHIEEVTNRINNHIKDTKQLSFKAFTEGSGRSGKEGRVYAVVSFLALLEMVKNGILQAHQEATFNDIHMTSHEQ